MNKIIFFLKSKLNFIQKSAVIKIYHFPYHCTFSLLYLCLDFEHKVYIFISLMDH